MPNSDLKSSEEDGSKNATQVEKDLNKVSEELGECSKNLEQEADDDELTNIATPEEYLDKKQIILLDYERQMFLDMVHTDGLLISAKGVSYDRVLINLLKVYSDSANLILVINSSDWEEFYYKPQLKNKYVHEVSNSVTERERVYLEGGIQFISTRILVVDLLKGRIPIELITGIIVLRAHSIIESCQEAFALRLYRQKNKTGFIKGFSNSAEAFTFGYSHVERTMRNLFVKELYLWPRFHATIQQSLKPYESQAIEFHVPMSIKMTQIQTHILDLMNYLVKEIKRINRNVDMEEITVENCVTKKFHKILQAQLDTIWHQLSTQTKLIVADLKVLRNLIISTIYGDAVNSYDLIKRYRTTEYAMNNSGWILLDAAENLFKISKDRVYNKEGEFDPEFCPKWKALTEILRVEIPNDAKKCGFEESSTPVKALILCQDSRTCYQLNQFLTQGAQKYLFVTALKNDIPVTKLSSSYKNVSKSSIKEEIPKNQQDAKLDATKKQLNKSTKAANKESELLFGKSSEENSQAEDNELSEVLTKDDALDCALFRESYVLTITQNLGDLTDMNNENESSDVETSIFEPFPEMENLDVTAAISSKKLKQPVICIQTFKTEKEGSKGLDRILDEFQPQYIIMYHCNVTAVRQLEVHEAKLRRKAKDRLRIFFLFHARTVEEQSYLTSLRREKQAFELLIDTKKKMIVPEYQDGKTDEAFTLLKPHDPDDDEKSGKDSRKAGGQQSKAEGPIVASKIIVDMREFRSDLPCLIHRRGIEVLPVTITIGDYILTPEICVERKSISDLIGSLNSGRLYNQCIQMQRFYAKPILLIEFDQNKPFHLQGKYMLSGDSGITSNADIVQKLQLLTLHFPKLRLIWSPSPYATAQLFEELKQGKEEPDPTKAAAIGSDESTQFEIDKFNSNIYDFLIRLPGINSRNINKIMRHGGCMKELLKKSKKELSDLCDSEANGKLLWDILHVAHLPDKDPTTTNNLGKNTATKLFSGKFRGRGRGRKF